MNAKAARPGFRELFTPKLVTVLREGYGLGALRADALAGLTVAVVALPLSMAIAIASGLSPERGLYTAIVGGFLISALGGCRFQIGGPAGAFIVLISSIVERQGVDGLMLATAMAGVLMIAAGLLRLGAYVKFIPYPVAVGFTAGIAVIIFASQIKELLGLDLLREPAALAPKLAALWNAAGSIRPAALLISLLGVAVILLLRRWRPTWPGMLIAVVACSLVAVLLHLDIATIGARFGQPPSHPPRFDPVALDLARLRALAPDALAIALLGSIESLLSAVVADSMTGGRHRSNGELVAQGIANVAAANFGGMPVTGAIARTAANIRAGARSPVSGMLHAAFLLVFMLIAAPLAAFIPLAALGAVLAVVAWNMAERREFAALLRASPGDALVLLVTFLLTIFEDLTLGIGAGLTLSALITLRRLSGALAVEIEDDADNSADDSAALAPREADFAVARVSGAFFFGSAAAAIGALDRIGGRPRVLALDLSAAPAIDSTAAHALRGHIEAARKMGSKVYIVGAGRSTRRALLLAGLRPPLARYAATPARARQSAAARGFLPRAKAERDKTPPAGPTPSGN